MTQKCVITNRKPMYGNTVSHANNKTPRRFNINLKYKRFWDAKKKKFVRLRVSTKGIRIIDKIGLDKVLCNN